MLQQRARLGWLRNGARQNYGRDVSRSVWPEKALATGISPRFVEARDRDLTSTYSFDRNVLRAFVLVLPPEEVQVEEA